jgi:hypothetical protein
LFSIVQEVMIDDYLGGLAESVDQVRAGKIAAEKVEVTY